MARRGTKVRTIARRGSSAAEKRLAQLRESSRRQRAKANAERNEMKQLATMGLTSAVLGWAENRGFMARIPSVGGLPKLVTVGAVGLIGSQYVGGTAGDIMRGAGASAACIAAYQLANRGSISGTHADSDMEAAVNRLAARVAGDDIDDIDYIGDDVEDVEFVFD